MPQIDGDSRPISQISHQELRRGFGEDEDITKAINRAITRVPVDKSFTDAAAAAVASDDRD